MLKQHVKQCEEAANLAVQKKQEKQAAQSFTPYWNFFMIDDDEVLQAREKFMKVIQTFLQRFSRYPCGVMPKVLLIDWERFSEIKHAFTDKQYQPEEIQELMCKLLEDVQNINEELSGFTNSSSWYRPMIVDDEKHSIQYRLYLENSSKAITSVLPIEEPEYSLSMEDEHLDTIQKTESDELIKSNVENLVLIPSEYKVISDNESECDVPVNNESSPIFTTFSNPLFDCNDDFTSSDDKLLSNEDVPMENFKIYSNPLFDDEEIISTKIDLHYFKLNAEIADTIFGSLSPSPIPVEDGDSHMEEIDLFLATDNLMPPSIENDDYDSEGDINFLKELLSNDPLPLPKNESSNFDRHDDPSFPRPPPKPPDVEGEVRLMFLQMLKMTFTLSSYLSFEFFYRISPTLRFLLYFSPPGVKTPFLTPASPLRAGGISSGWNFHVL
nr:hypothetical protein [Tanacetum cinerariifolium]